MDNVTIEGLKKIHGDKAGEVYREICDRGGFGNVPTSYEGGLDVRGVVDPSNTALTESQKSKIAELAGMTKKDRERIEAGHTTGTPDKK